LAKLTEKFIAAFKPEHGKKDRLAFDSEVKGLGVRASGSGSKAFLVQWTDPATGRKAREPLGTWGAITLEQAREAARIRLGRLAAGFDPKAEREARKAEDEAKREAKARTKADAAYTVQALIQDWEALHLANRRPRYAAEATRALRLAFQAHLEAPASALTHEVVIHVLDRLACEGKNATARLTMAYGRACYGWAVKRRKLPMNPFAGLPAIEGGTTSRERVLSPEEVGAVWRAAGKLSVPHGPMVRLGLLTLARREELAGMRWGEVAADLSVWTQPGAKTKNGKTHMVHLSAPARALLRAMIGAEQGKSPAVLPAADRLVFGVGERQITAHSWVKRALQGAIDTERAEAGGTTDVETMPAWVLHDFRRSGVTWLAENDFPPHIADRLLNHLGGTISGVAKVYQRGEFLTERARALELWGAHVVACGDGKPAARNVVPLSRVGRGRKVQ